MRARAPAIALGLALAALAGPVSAAPAGAPIVIDITGVRYPGGSMRVDVCTQETFLKTTCPYSGSAPARLGETQVTVTDVPPGTYAIQAFHDINDNGRVDRGALGMPKEGLAFSNDAPLGMHGPTFAHAAFTHGVSSQTLQIRLKHFRRIVNGRPEE